MDKVQYRYEDIERIAHQFSELHQRVAESAVKFGQQLQVLENGGWVGRGFDQFEAEVTSEVVPALRRLADILEETSAVVLQAGERMQQAEEEARGRFITSEAPPRGSPAPLGGAMGGGTWSTSFGGSIGFPDVPLYLYSPPVAPRRNVPLFGNGLGSDPLGPNPFVFPVLPPT